MRELPPARYRVVERGRRLEVIDALRGEPVRPAPVGAEDDSEGANRHRLATLLPRKLSFDGTAELRTQRFYDAGGPRTIRLDPSRMTTLKRAGMGLVAAIVVLAIAAMKNPWLLTVPVLIHIAGVGTVMRKRIKGWFDAAEADTGSTAPSSPRT